VEDGLTSRPTGELLVLVAVAALMFMSGCASLTPAGEKVAVYQAPLDGTPAQRSMPEGCRLIASTPPVAMPEIDLLGQKDPFRKERNEAGAAGANALLVLSIQTVGRHTFECPGSSPISDCGGGFGAWYRVQVESYACTADALGSLPSFGRRRATPPVPNRTP
jgi:hypothetical protein